MTISVLIPDGESEFALFVMHCLAPRHDVRIHVAGEGRWPSTRLSRFCASYTRIPAKVDETSWLSIVSDIVRRRRIDVLLPVGPRGISATVRHREALTSFVAVVPTPTAESLATADDKGRLATFLDGARLLNAAVASGRAAGELAEPFDLVATSLSKGLGAPAGSLLAGSRQLIGRATRYRRMMGGAMRQVGILAAGGSQALRHNVERLADDHANARRLAERLSASPGIELDPAAVETNIVVFRLIDAPGVPDAATFVAACAERGVKIFPFGPRVVRAVTHMDVSAAQVARAGEIMAAVAAGT